MENYVVGFRNVSLRIIELGTNCLHSTSFTASTRTFRNNSENGYDSYDDDDKWRVVQFLSDFYIIFMRFPALERTTNFFLSTKVDFKDLLIEYVMCMSLCFSLPMPRC